MYIFLYCYVYIRWPMYILLYLFINLCMCPPYTPLHSLIYVFIYTYTYTYTYIYIYINTGTMDFKVAGNESGITTFQVRTICLYLYIFMFVYICILLSLYITLSFYTIMCIKPTKLDIKSEGLTMEIIERALLQVRVL
jgi:hypothetical protein